MNRSIPIGVALGLRHTLTFSRDRFWWVLLGLCGIWTMLLSRIARDSNPTEATTAALLGPVFGIAIPLALFAYSRQVTREGLRETTRTLSALGISRPAFALGAAAVLILSAVGLAVILGSLSLLLIRGLGDPTLLVDLCTTGWVGALGAAAYVCCFAALGASGSRMQGFAFLLLDWMLGSRAGLSALIWPRAHLASLLGAASTLPASPGSSVLMLWAVTLLAGGLLVFRVSR